MSPLALKLGRPAGAASAGATAGLKVPLNFGGRLVAGTARSQQALRAVAVAEAVSRPGKALTLAKKGLDDLGAVIGDPKKPADDVIQPVLNEVGRIQDDRSKAPADIDDVIREVSADVGADRALAMAAYAKLEGDAALGEAARFWVVEADAKLLHDAARAAARRQRLGQVPTPAKETAALKDTVAKLEKTVSDGFKDVDGKLSALDTRVKKLEATIGGGRGQST